MKINNTFTLFMSLFSLLTSLSAIQWFKYRRDKKKKYEHFLEKLAKPCPDSCHDSACCIAAKLKIGSEIMEGGIKKFKPLIPHPKWDGTRGRVDTLLMDVGAITSSTILTIAQGGKLAIDTALMSADLGSAFIQSVQ
jgi:hypothetical protein